MSRKTCSNWPELLVCEGCLPRRKICIGPEEPFPVEALILEQRRIGGRCTLRQDLPAISVRGENFLFDFPDPAHPGSQNVRDLFFIQPGQHCMTDHPPVGNNTESAD